MSTHKRRPAAEQLIAIATAAREIADAPGSSRVFDRELRYAYGLMNLSRGFGTETKIEGWPAAVHRALDWLSDQRKEIPRGFGWTWADRPVEEWAAFLEDRKAEFLREYERPYWDAYLSLGSDDGGLRTGLATQAADEARARGHRGTLPAEQAAGVIDKVSERYFLTPILGSQSPILSRECQEELRQAAAILETEALRKIASRSRPIESGGTPDAAIWRAVTLRQIEFAFDVAATRSSLDLLRKEGVLAAWRSDDGRRTRFSVVLGNKATPEQVKKLDEWRDGRKKNAKPDNQEA
jgi:hypothetical protein